MHRRDEELLKEIKANLNGVGSSVGKVSGRDECYYSVSSLKHIIEVVLPHFDQYPLLTQKRVDYLFFRKVVMMMQRGEHLNLEGLKKIVAIKASINKGGLSEQLATAFPSITPMARPFIPFCGSFATGAAEEKIEYTH